MFETSKNLTRVFRVARARQVVLLFDEALQEIELYGDGAQADRKKNVDTWIGGVRRIVGKGILWFDARYLNQDYFALKDNYFRVKGQRAVLDGNLPTWKQNAKSWREYLHDLTSKSLVATPEKQVKGEA